VAGVREALEALRDEADDAGAFDRLFFAHSFADVQVDLEDELRWDLDALHTIDELTEDEAEREGVPGGRAGLLPSLHLNVADAQRRLGHEEEAQRHYALGLEHLDALDDDAYGRSLRAAFDAFATPPDGPPSHPPERSERA
jgi:hypothetical protein